MPKYERLSAEEAHSMLLREGFEWIRSKGSHRIYKRGPTRIVIPFHPGKILHPKIAKQIQQSISK